VVVAASHQLGYVTIHTDGWIELDTKQLDLSNQQSVAMFACCEVLNEYFMKGLKYLLVNNNIFPH